MAAPQGLFRNNEEPIFITMFAKIQAPFRAFGEIIAPAPRRPPVRLKMSAN